MLKSKRFNVSMAAVVVLAVVLAMAITAGATLAWFASQASAGFELSLGDSVVIKVADNENEIASGEANIRIPAGYLVPGMGIYPTVFAAIEDSTTSALLRAKVEITVSNVDQDEIDTMEAHLLAQMKAKANGWYLDESDTVDTYFYFVGNGASYSKVMTAVAVDGGIGGTFTPTAYATAGLLLLPDGTTNKDDNYAAFGPAAGTADTALVDGKIASIVTLAANPDNSPVNPDYADSEQTLDGHANIPFLIRALEIPHAWGNEVANAQIEITITFEAIQDYIVDLDQTGVDVRTQVLPTLAAAKSIFESALDLNPTQP